MSEQPTTTAGSDRLIMMIKTAYWVALLIIAAMAMASFIFLQQMMAAQQRDESVLTLTATQKALSQRVVFLANAIDNAPADKKRGLLTSLREATGEFESNYDLLLKKTGADAASPARLNPDSVESVLFAKPFHLDYFSMGLAANGWRLVSVIEGEIGAGDNVIGYRAGIERARLDETVANVTLAGYQALGDRIQALANQRLASMLNVHRLLFYSTIGIIVLIALFIFRPMSDVILRRTHELVDARNSMAFIAVHDGLTGLHNRTFLTDHFDTLIKGAHRRGERLAVLQLDLDRFKQINDTLGHAAGDAMLRGVAQCLRGAVRVTDLPARLGGDEFAVLMPETSREAALTVAERIRAGVEQFTAQVDGRTIHSTVSIGLISRAAGDVQDLPSLIHKADDALYKSKTDGRNRVTVWDAPESAALAPEQTG